MLWECSWWLLLLTVRVGCFNLSKIKLLFLFGPNIKLACVCRTWEIWCGSFDRIRSWRVHDGTTLHLFWFDSAKVACETPLYLGNSIFLTPCLPRSCLSQKSSVTLLHITISTWSAAGLRRRRRGCWATLSRGSNLQGYNRRKRAFCCSSTCYQQSNMKVCCMKDFVLV